MGVFKTPAWAKQKTESTHDEEAEKQSLFSHSDSFMSIRMEQMDRDKRRAEKAREVEQKAVAKKERREEKKRDKQRSSSCKRESEDSETDSTFKKRRINSEDSNALLLQAGISLGNIGDVERNTKEDEPIKDPSRTSSRSKRFADTSGPIEATRSIEIRASSDDDDDDDLRITSVTSRPNPSARVAEEEEDSDPEIAALRQRARENSRLKEQQQLAAVTYDHPSSDTISRLPTPTPHDPTIIILIESPIPDTKPLIVHRKLSQNLQPVKDAWCSKQAFSDTFAKGVFLTFCGRRLWGATTVKRLGLDVDETGRVYKVDDRSKQDVERVHVEAMTEEIFQSRKAEKLRRAELAMVEDSEGTQPSAAIPDAEAMPQAERFIRLTVKAKGKQDWKAKVTPATLISKIIKSAKKQMQIAAEQEAGLEFDGERLGPGGVVGDTEIEDLDCVDLLVLS